MFIARFVLVLGVPMLAVACNDTQRLAVHDSQPVKKPVSDGMPTADTRSHDTLRLADAVHTEGIIKKDGAPIQHKDRGPSDQTLGDGTQAICDPWQDMGLDCCDVCTQIYVKCGAQVSRQTKALSGPECMTTCSIGGRAVGMAYNFFKCFNFQLTCDAQKLQTCFDSMFTP